MDHYRRKKLIRFDGAAYAGSWDSCDRNLELIEMMAVSPSSSGKWMLMGIHCHKLNHPDAHHYRVAQPQGTHPKGSRKVWNMTFLSKWLPTSVWVFWKGWVLGYFIRCFVERDKFVLHAHCVCRFICVHFVNCCEKIPANVEPATRIWREQIPR